MSIIADASSYIKDLQQKIAKLNQETASAQHANVCQPLVSVGVLDKGFLINVFMDKSCPPGLLASILEAFDEIGLTVLEARATCAGSFRLEAVGEVRTNKLSKCVGSYCCSNTIYICLLLTFQEEDEGLIDARAVEQAVVQAIKNCPTN